MTLTTVYSGNEARGFVARKAAGVCTRPRAWLGPSVSEYDPDTDSGDGTECPTCGRDDFKSTRGMKMHHSQMHGESIAGVEVACSWCGELKRVGSYRKEKLDNHFCDSRCEGEWRAEHQTGENAPAWKGGNTEVECAWCGAEKEVYPTHAEKRERFFCHDKDCMARWNSENLSGENNPLWKEYPTVYCAWCQTPKKVKPAVESNSERHFCDGECVGKWLSENQSGEDHPCWDGGFSYGVYGGGWTVSKKEVVRERQNRECAGCGVHEEENGRRLPVHHIVKARWLVDAPDEVRNGEDNLVALCDECHPKWEQMSPLRPQTPYLD